MATLTGQSYWALVAQALLVDHICFQRCLSIMVTVANLCGPMVTHLKTGKLAESPSFEELPMTSHHRARCEPFIRRVLVFVVRFRFVLKLRTLHYLCTLMYFQNSCNNSFIRAMYVMYYVTMLRCWQFVRILVNTNHPCLRVGRHRWYQSLTGIIHRIWSYFWKLWWGYA
jgi:hypothetical protein